MVTSGLRIGHRANFTRFMAIYPCSTCSMRGSKEFGRFSTSGLADVRPAAPHLFGHRNHDRLWPGRPPGASLGPGGWDLGGFPEHPGGPPKLSTNSKLGCGQTSSIPNRHWTQNTWRGAHNIPGVVKLGVGLRGPLGRPAAPHTREVWGAGAPPGSPTPH